MRQSSWFARVGHVEGQMAFTAGLQARALQHAGVLCKTARPELHLMRD